jgi:hypothetical protein
LADALVPGNLPPPPPPPVVETAAKDGLVMLEPLASLPAAPDAPPPPPAMGNDTVAGPELMVLWPVSTPPAPPPPPPRLPPPPPPPITIKSMTIGAKADPPTGRGNGLAAASACIIPVIVYVLILHNIGAVNKPNV